MELKEKYPIILSVSTGIVTILYCLLGRFQGMEIIKNTLFIMVCTLVLSYALKIYLNIAVFKKEQDLSEEEENSEEIQGYEGFDSFEYESMDENPMEDSDAGETAQPTATFDDAGGDEDIAVYETSAEKLDSLFGDDAVSKFEEEEVVG